MFLASEQLESDPSSRGLEWENFPDQRFGRCRSKHTLAGGDHGAKIFNCFVTACEVFRTKLDQDTQLNCSVVCIFLVHVALQDFQFVLASAQARNYAPMHQIRPRHAAEFQRGV